MEELAKIGLSSFTWPNVIAAFVRSLILWCKLGERELTVLGFGKLWELCGLAGNVKRALELLSFLGLGVAVGIAFARPENVVQAFTAGLGWTGLLTTSKTPSRSSPRLKTSKG